MGQFLRRWIGTPIGTDFAGALEYFVALALCAAVLVLTVEIEFGLGALDQPCDEAVEKFCRSPMNLSTCSHSQPRPGWP